MIDREIKFADLFAGGGGTSTGAFMVPGIHVSWALNHDPIAIKTHAANHPETKHYQADIRTQSVKELDPVDVLWASLECTNHSKAKGGKDKNEGSFTLGWELPRYLIHCNPDYVYIENVPEFIRWGELKEGKRVKGKEGLEYRKWIQRIKDLGYVNYDRKFLNAADYGCPTRRIRYFGIFSKSGFPIVWPKPTHAEKENMFGLPKWKPCKDYIDLTNEGKSIFGRETRPLVDNTLRRLAGGIKKFAPELFFIMKYYGNGDNCQSINSPLHTIRTKESHCLIKCEKLQFIQDYCHQDRYDTPDKPMSTLLTWQTKQLITVEKQQFIQDHCHSDSYNSIDEPLKTQTARQTKELVSIEKKFIAKYYNGDRKNGKYQHHCQGVDEPFPTIKTIDGSVVVTAKAQFISSQYNSNGNPGVNNSDIKSPLPSPTTKEKFQFITAYFNSSGNPGSQNQSIEKPLGSILTGENKKALVTVDNENLFDFDIKMRFLTDEELSSIMGFPEGYFHKPELKLSRKEIIKMVGNAVPVGMARALLEPVTRCLLEEMIMQIAV